MSDVQTITKLESLPNEIFIECFEYLNAIDIFSAFDYLNSRFNDLIRNIPLHLNVHEVKQPSLIQFGIKMLLNPRMKKQIVSLELSDEKTDNNSETLFSFISLNEFSNLRRLILSDLNLDMDSRIGSMLPILPSLRYFCSKDSSLIDARLLASLSQSAIQTLSIASIPRDLLSIRPFTALVNLNISSCCVGSLCDLLEYTPGLQCVTIENIRQSYGRTINQSKPFSNRVVHLKRLVIHNFPTKFDDLERILKRTPSLKMLMISSRYNLDIADACTWRKLIRTFLPLLKIFKFKFEGMLNDDDNNHLSEFRQFHTNFWREEHQWYVEYVINENRALVYTVPYISNQYEILANTKRCYHESANNMKTFANVTDLTVCLQNTQNDAEYHFPNVKSLKLEATTYGGDQDCPFLKRKHIEYLKTLVNVFNLTHLEISGECRWKSSSVMPQLLKTASNLTSLKIEIHTLKNMFNNSELCMHLSKAIKKLDLTARLYGASLDSNEIVKVCQIFSNLEVFRCCIGTPDNLEMVLDEISKLPHLKVFSYETYNRSSGHRWTGDREAELNLYSFTVNCEYRGYDLDSISSFGYDHDYYDDLDLP